MNDVLARLKKAIAEGAALATLGLAGCGSPIIPSVDSGSPPMDSGVVADSGTLSPIPSGLDSCHGPSWDGGYHGQCCNRVQCIACGQSPQLPPGSGTCSCALQEGSSKVVDGPFAGANAGECCFVVGTIYCDGRPLLVEGEAVTAPVVSRSDWA
jgi:hypothetical protein